MIVFQYKSKNGCYYEILDANIDFGNFVKGVKSRC